MESTLIHWIYILLAVQTFLVSAKQKEWIPPETAAFIKEKKYECMEKHGTTQEILEMVNDGTLSNDRSLNCYVDCLFSTYGVVSDDGGLNLDQLKNFYPEELRTAALEALTPCRLIPGADPCETMYNIGKCVMERNPDMWFFV